MIKSFKHKGLERFFKNEDISGIQAKHKERLELLLTAIDKASAIFDLSAPTFNLHRLKGNKKHLWSVKVSGNWRITFEFSEGNAYILDYEDYH